jgi:hypothetical protein
MTKLHEAVGSKKDDTFRVLSFGGGVQSSALALLWAQGEMPGEHPTPEVGIFADTGSEPQTVYDWIAWLEPNLSFPIIRVSAGNLGDDVLQAWRGGATRVSNPPFRIVQDGQNAKDHGILLRKCTRDYKATPIDRWIRAHRDGRNVIQYFGISLDEVHRMRTSPVKYKKYAYPLVDARWTRHTCIKWLERLNLPTMPPRSACFFCPYRSNAEWRAMKDRDPAAWDAAVEFDAELRKPGNRGPNTQGDAFIHRSATPLGTADINDTDPDQVDMFGNECEGMCGV